MENKNKEKHMSFTENKEISDKWHRRLRSKSFKYAVILFLAVLLCAIQVSEYFDSIQQFDDSYLLKNAVNIDPRPAGFNTDPTAAPDTDSLFFTNRNNATNFFTSTSYVNETLIAKSGLNETTNNNVTINESNSVNENSNNSLKNITSGGKWCPFASCHNSPLCAPCNRRFLFIISTGRSGSTTLLEMMNMLPNVRISGENYNELYYMYNLIRNLEQGGILTKGKGKAKGKNLNTNSTSSSYNLINPKQEISHGAFRHGMVPKGAMGCALQQFLATMNPPPASQLKSMNMESYNDFDQHTILGVKTIRMHKGSWDAQLAARFLKEHFPCSRYILNFRSDLSSRVNSTVTTFEKSVKKDEQELEQKFVSQTSFIQKLAKELGPNLVKSLDMTQWTQSETIGLQTINEIVSELGFQNCKFDQMLHYNDGGINNDASDTNLGWNCTSPTF